MGEGEGLKPGTILQRETDVMFFFCPLFSENQASTWVWTRDIMSSKWGPLELLGTKATAGLWRVRCGELRINIDLPVIFKRSMTIICIFVLFRLFGTSYLISHIKSVPVKEELACKRTNCKLPSRFLTPYLVPTIHRDAQRQWMQSGSNLKWSSGLATCET